MKLISKIIIFFENQSLTFNGWVISFFLLLGLNLFFQFITYNFKSISFEYFIGSFIQSYYFILYLAIVIFLYLIIGKRSSVECQKLKVKSKKSNVEIFNSSDSVSQILKTKNLKISECAVDVNFKNTKQQQNKNVQMLNILNFVLWGFWSIIFWPIIDKIILKEQFYLSFYIYDGIGGIFQKMITFFGPITPVGILYGTRIETIFIILFTGIYVFYKTKSPLKTLIGGVGVYIIFYISVALPSFLVFIVTFFSGDSVVKIVDLDVVKFFNTPLQYFGIAEKNFAVTFFYKLSLFYNLIFIGLLIWLQFLWNKDILNSLIKNIRFPQMMFNWGLLLAGLTVGFYYIPENFKIDIFSGVALINLFLSVLFVWLFSVVINDIEDYKVDKVSNKQRPLTKKIIYFNEYLNYGYIFLFLSLLLAITISGKTFLLILLYSLITLIYSKKPFKLKRIPWVAGIISALASLLIFLIGYFLITNNSIIDDFPWRILIFLFLIYALILPIKDLKDIEADKYNNITTVANLLGERVARIYFGSVLFLGYILSVFILTINKLFFLAVILGGVSYWIINNPKNTRDKLLYKLFFPIIIYIIALIFLG
jgi:4-hydroxybenzoate polyprenyltransferase